MGIRALEAAAKALNAVLKQQQRSDDCEVEEITVDERGKVRVRTRRTIEVPEGTVFPPIVRKGRK